MRCLLFSLLLLASLAPPDLLAAAKKPPLVTIRLHGEGSASEGPSFSAEVQLENPPKKIYMHKVPAVNEGDIKAFYPFPGNDGLAGAYFLLDAHGTNKLQQFTIEENGRLAIILINGRITAAMKITAPVKDGLLYVPGGILPGEIAALQTKFPILGNEAEFGKKPRPPKKNVAQ